MCEPGGVETDVHMGRLGIGDWRLGTGEMGDGGGTIHNSVVGSWVLVWEVV